MRGWQDSADEPSTWHLARLILREPHIYHWCFFLLLELCLIAIDTTESKTHCIAQL